ncbi:MAG: DUF4255 domain-containing protein [Candidatus Bathyarchaeia archaeon]|jgi:hypothetical protein
MCQKAFISDADSALANLVWRGIENESGAKSIISSQEQISFSSPKAAGAHGSRKLLIFLYNITEEPAMRNIALTAGVSRDGANLKTFALHYLITPVTGNDKDDHALLETIIHILLATPSIYANEKNSVGLMVKMDSLSLDELRKLWIALGTPLRLSVSLTASSAQPEHDSQAQVTSSIVAPEKAEPDTKNVTQLYQAVLKTFAEQSDGWKNRNMVVKQWLLQDFKKNTNMTVEEMFTTLNNLGDKLEQHCPTTQFVKPLNLLAGYYKHQLDQLKGMHKVSHNQAENLETINIWIKDVETLVEALGPLD